MRSTVLKQALKKMPTGRFKNGMIILTLSLPRVLLIIPKNSSIKIIMYLTMVSGLNLEMSIK